MSNISRSRKQQSRFENRMATKCSTTLSSNNHSGAMSTAAAAMSIRNFSCHLLPMSTCLVFYLFCSAHIFALSMAKFTTNTRYGRRSDLPPLAAVGPSLLSSNEANADSSYNQDMVISKNLWLKPATLIEDYSSLWCVTLEPKNHIYKCFDKYSLIHRRPSDISNLGAMSMGSRDQDQS